MKGRGLLCGARTTTQVKKLFPTRLMGSMAIMARVLELEEGSWSKGPGRDA